MSPPGGATASPFRLDDEEPFVNVVTQRSTCLAPTTPPRSLMLLLAIGLTAGATPSRSMSAPADSSESPSRARVVVPDPRTEAIEELLEATVNAMNREDLDAVEMCFVPDQRTAARRRLGVLLVAHSVALELEDHHVLEYGDDRAEVGIKYHVTLDDSDYVIVSHLTLARHQDEWLIRRESVRSIGGGPAGCGSGRGGVRNACIGGRCPLP